MKFTVDKKDIHVVLQLQTQTLNTVNAPDLKSELVLLHAEGFRYIILDLSQVNFIDSSGLSSILIGNRLCKEADGTFVLTGAHPNVKQLIQISQLNSILTTLPTVQEAEDYVKMEELTKQITQSE